MPKRRTPVAQDFFSGESRTGGRTDDFGGLLPPGPPTPPGLSEPSEPSDDQPEYHSRTDSWSGNGAPTKREWSALKRDIYPLLRWTSYGGSGEVTGKPGTDLPAIIEMIEGGFSVADVRDLTDMQRNAVTDWANGDVSRGRALQRHIQQQGLPVELGYYHWKK